MKIFEVETNTEDLATQMKKECSLALKAFKQTNKLLYRGYFQVSMPESTFFKMTPKSGRSPRDTDRTVHDEVNSDFTKAGFISNRSNSIFATSNRYTALGYSKSNKGDQFDDGLYLVIPTNKATRTITWSPAVYDMTNQLGKLAGKYIEKNMPNEDPEFIDYTEIYLKLFKSEMLPTFKTGNFPAALLSGNEILISGECYLLQARKGERWMIQELGINL